MLDDKIYKQKVIVENGNCIKSSVSINNFCNIPFSSLYLKYIEQFKKTYLDFYDLSMPFVNMFSIKCINDEGNINKLAKWIIEGYWENFGSTIDIEK